MRVLFAALITCGIVVGLQSAEVKNRPSISPAAGLEYVNLEDWAVANDLHFSISRKDEEVKLTNRCSRLALKVNSLRAEMNGIVLFLSHPVTLRQGMVSVSQQDLDRSLKPILVPSKNKPGQLVKTVAIGAGHGGKDCGYQVSSQQEKKYTLLLARELEKLVKRAGLKPVVLRSSDRFVDLDDRAWLAKRGKADIYVELHYNCAGPGNTESRGVEVYCLTPPGAISTNGGTEQYPGPLHGNRHDERNILLAYQLQSALVEKVGLVDRGVRRARFVVLRDAEMPAALIEAGFMSQPEEMRKIQDPAYRHQTAQAILDGLLAYKRQVER